jgi:hypothetical protein
LDNVRRSFFTFYPKFLSNSQALTARTAALALHIAAGATAGKQSFEKYADRKKDKYKSSERTKYEK